jgi:L-cystine transport system permease protein
MMGRGETLIAATAHALEVYLSLAVIYYAVVLLFEKIFRLYEKRINRHHSVDVSVTG